jgi:hypothetical protein
VRIFLIRLHLPVGARHRRVAIGIVSALIVVGMVLWGYRWKISRTAVTIADPMVRAWAADQVLDASDSAYRLTASTIVVDDAHRRIGIDSITLITDTARNNRLARPHPEINATFRRCALTGIDLSQLAGGRGLHALHAGCDSVTISARTLVAPPPDTTATASAPDADSSNFLRFQGQLDLPSILPLIGIDVVAFPHVHVAFDLLSADGRRTSVSVDSVAVELDSMHIDPQEGVTKRRPLFSRDITVRLDRFDGSTKAGTHISLEHLLANLEDGTCRLDAIAMETPTHSTLRTQHVSMSGVRWRSFLLSGDVAVARINLDTTTIRIAPAHVAPAAHSPKTPPRLADFLESFGHTVQVDSLTVKAVRIVELGRTSADSTTTTLRMLQMARFGFQGDSAWWKRPNIIGVPTVHVDHLFRHTARMDIALASLTIDAATHELAMDSLRAAPEGDDSAFEQRNPYRKARLSVAMNQVRMHGIDVDAFVRRGALRTRTLAVAGLVLDVMKDKHKPEDPAPNIVRRFPQQVLRDAATEIQVDTITASGLVTYREREENSPLAGTLTFGAIQIHGYNFSTDPKRMTAATPFRLIGDTRLMGAGAMHVEWDVPLLARDFAMQWHGSLGRIDPKAMNAFLPYAVGMKFTDGVFEGATWSAAVTDGVAKGRLTPIWHNLHVDFPGVSRDNPGLIGGVMRGITKLAANTFGIRADNDSADGNQPIEGSITHRWVNIETLPQFIWFQLREPLLLILKK